MKGRPYGGERVPGAILLTVVGIVLMASGCGGTAEPSAPTVTQRITRDFGTEPVAAQRAPLTGHRTVLKLLKGYEDVTMGGIGNDSVKSIDELEARWQPEIPDGHITAWILNVNGIEADEDPDEYPLADGDVVQWDLRDWHLTLSVRATVGAFPETFTRGVYGRRVPVTVRCAPSSDAACADVRGALREVGVRIDGVPPPGPPPPEGEVQRATILVGPWNHWREDRWPSYLDRGGEDSGVFAEFSRSGDRLHLLNWNVHRARTAGAGTGLVAAHRPTEADLQWFVTGVDERGVERAAAALTSPDLRDSFAAAVTDDGIVKLPLAPR